MDTVLLRAYAAALPEVLSDLLDQRVSLELLIRAKIAYFKYLLGTDLPDDIERLPGVAIDSVGNNLRRWVDLKKQLPQLPEILARSGKTEIEAIIDGPPRMSEVAAKRLRMGDLTLRELLVLQPSVILVNK